MNTQDNMAKVVVAPENPLKQMLVNYVGENYSENLEEDTGITVEMITSILALEFPELIILMAEENWVRGYKQGLDDATRIPKAAAESA